MAGAPGVEGPAPRILVVTTTYPRSEGDSTPRFVADLCERLVAEHGVVVTVLAPHAPGIPRCETMRGVRVERFRYALDPERQAIAYGAGVMDNLRSRPAARRQLPGFLAAMAAGVFRRLGDHDLVHAHWAPPGAVASAANLLHRRPTVLTLHRLSVPCSRLERFALRRADRVLFNSRFTLEQAERQGCRFRGEVAYQGFDPEVFAPAGDPDGRRRLSEPLRRLGVPEGATVVAGVARLVRFKGFDVLLAAADRFLAGRPGVHLVIAGDGPERPGLEARAAASPHAGRIHLPGALDRDGVAALLAAAELFVNPAIDRPDGFVETLGVATLEAAATGVPAVGSRVGGVPETIEDGVTGVLVPPGDPAALASAVGALLDHPERRASLGRAARERVRERFSWSTLARQVAAVYRRLLAGEER